MSTNIVVPELGESVVEARVAKWLKKQGDSVNAGDPLVELETEKIDLEVSADRAGVLANIKHQEGADVKVGEVLAILEEAPTAHPTAPAQAPRCLRCVRCLRCLRGLCQVPMPKGSTRKQHLPQRTSLEVTMLISESLKDRDQADESLRDVLKAAAPTGTGTASSQGTNPAPQAPYRHPRHPGQVPAGERSETRERMTKRRATIARRLVEAQQTAAMLTTFNEVDMSAVMQLRERRKEAFTKKYGVGVGIASFFVKAAIDALKAFPQVNAEIQGDEIVYKHYYDIGMAVGAEGGLVVPVLRDADRMSLRGHRAVDSRSRASARRTAR